MDVQSAGGDARTGAKMPKVERPAGAKERPQAAEVNKEVARANPPQLEGPYGTAENEAGGGVEAPLDGFQLPAVPLEFPALPNSWIAPNGPLHWMAAFGFSTAGHLEQLPAFFQPLVEHTRVVSPGPFPSISSFLNQLGAGATGGEQPQQQESRETSLLPTGSKRKLEDDGEAELPATEQERAGEKWRLLVEAAHSFRALRKALKLTQHDVAESINEIFGTEFSIATLSRFENAALPVGVMEEAGCIFFKWVYLSMAIGRTFEKSCQRMPKRVENLPVEHTNEQPPAVKLRRKRHCFKPAQLELLKREFVEHNWYLPKERARQLAQEMGLPRQTVQSWFATHRHRLRKEGHSPPNEQTDEAGEAVEMGEAGPSGLSEQTKSEEAD